MFKNSHNAFSLFSENMGIVSDKYRCKKDTNMLAHVGLLFSKTEKVIREKQKQVEKTSKVMIYKINS